MYVPVVLCALSPSLQSCLKTFQSKYIRVVLTTFSGHGEQTGHQERIMSDEQFRGLKRDDMKELSSSIKFRSGGELPPLPQRTCLQRTPPTPLLPPPSPPHHLFSHDHRLHCSALSRLSPAPQISDVYSHNAMSHSGDYIYIHVHRTDILF